jgi:hypothetical protein
MLQASDYLLLVAVLATCPVAIALVLIGVCVMSYVLVRDEKRYQDIRHSYELELLQERGD